MSEPQGLSPQETVERALAAARADDCVGMNSRGGRNLGGGIGRHGSQDFVSGYQAKSAKQHDPENSQEMPVVSDGVQQLPAWRTA